MAHWASSQDDEQQQGAGDSNTPINQKGPLSNDKIHHPLMDCGQGKNMLDAVGVGIDVAVGVGVDVASGQEDGERTRNGEADATGNDSAEEDVPKAIMGVNYPIAGAPHPTNKPLRLRTCESIPPPPHGATPPSSGSKSVRFATPPPYGAIPPSSGTMTVNRKSGPQPPPHGVVVPHATQALEGLQSPIVEQTGSLLTVAETDKLRQQNRRLRHALQEQQAPTTLWSTHTGQASLPPRQERPLEYRDEMCPVGIATSHPAGELLSE